jgi:hypothetical protein
MKRKVRKEERDYSKYTIPSYKRVAGGQSRVEIFFPESFVYLIISSPSTRSCP